MEQRNKEIEDILAKTSISKLKQNVKNEPHLPTGINPFQNEINKGEFIEHTVNIGDTIQGISLRYNLPVKKKKKK